MTSDRTEATGALILDGTAQLNGAAWFGTTTDSAGGWAGGALVNQGITLLPAGTYRVVARNQTHEYVRTLFTNTWVNPAANGITDVRYLEAAPLVQPNKPYISAGSDFVAMTLSAASTSAGSCQSPLYRFAGWGPYPPVLP